MEYRPCLGYRRIAIVLPFCLSIQGFYVGDVYVTGNIFRLFPAFHAVKVAINYKGV